MAIWGGVRPDNRNLGVRASLPPDADGAMNSSRGCGVRILIEASPNRPPLRTLQLGLSALAGLLDATGFLIANGYFVSFMSGNTTQLGVNALDGIVVEALILDAVEAKLAP